LSKGTMKKAINGILEGQDNLLVKYKLAIIKTNLGNIIVEFYGKDAPATVNNFLNLAENKFYNKTKFHRIIKDFMIQGGDPNSRDNHDVNTHGTGGPGYRFSDEINGRKLVRGSLAMANAGPNTNGSQFFIVTKESTPWLDGFHTNFGVVTSGFDVIDKIENISVDETDHPIEDVIIEEIELK
jgi:cyclophilin family peptidyl-prolyl cis-trans isomerase